MCKKDISAPFSPLSGRGSGGDSFLVIGIDDNQEQHFTPEVKALIASGKVFSGGKRHHEIMRPLLPAPYRWIDINVPLENVFEAYKEFDEVIVFASGDPLFYGFANTIQNRMPNAGIKVFPTFNSLQMLAHRLVMPYHDMHIVSLTGRTWDKLDEALIAGYEKIGILTDNKEHTPVNIARRMLDYGYDNYKMFVGELLGNNEKEKVSEWTLRDIAGIAGTNSCPEIVSEESLSEKNFAFPNNIILQRTGIRPRQFGIPENEFHLLDGRAKMITKMPVRLVSLSILGLREKAVFWDIGSCTGSVSVEAKMQFPHLKIIAFEKRPEGRELLMRNARKFGTPGIETVTGDFTDVNTTEYPRPDAVFIGGHGGKLIEIVAQIKDILNENGQIVFNSVSDDSRKLFTEAVKTNDLLMKQSISVKVDDHNTIEIMQACKK